MLRERLANTILYRCAPTYLLTVLDKYLSGRLLCKYNNRISSVSAGVWKKTINGAPYRWEICILITVKNKTEIKKKKK